MQGLGKSGVFGIQRIERLEGECGGFYTASAPPAVVAFPVEQGAGLLGLTPENPRRTGGRGSLVFQQQ